MKKTILPAILIFMNPALCLGSTYQLHDKHDTVIGDIELTYARYEQSLPDLARLHNLGFSEIKLANPAVDTWIPGEQQEIVLPKKFILPDAPHEGIVLNIPEMRLYYFPEVNRGEVKQVITHPIGIGREGWSTPYAKTSIIQKREKPSWYPPESIREEHAAEGRPLPKRVLPGPENPLGDYALRLGLPSYLIHGTNRPYGVGMRVSHGCIRLYPEDIESLFQQVTLGTSVRIVNQPYKAGVLDGKIYLQAHPFLDEDAEQFDGNLTSVVKMIVGLTGEREYTIDWELAKQAINERRGIPVQIGVLLNQEDGLVAGNSQPQDQPPLRTFELRLETNIQGVE